MNVEQLDRIANHLAGLGTKSNRPDYLTSITTQDLTSLIAIARVAQRIKLSWEAQQGVRLDLLRELVEVTSEQPIPRHPQPTQPQEP